MKLKTVAWTLGVVAFLALAYAAHSVNGIALLRRLHGG